jgi:hypothetical protein
VGCVKNVALLACRWRRMNRCSVLSFKYNGSYLRRLSSVSSPLSGTPAAAKYFVQHVIDQRRMGQAHHGDITKLLTTAMKVNDVELVRRRFNIATLIPSANALVCTALFHVDSGGGERVRRT